MDLDEAKRIVYDDEVKSMGRLLIAVNEFTKEENKGLVTNADLLQCLRRGKVAGRLTPVGEIAALLLYERSGRKRSLCKPYSDLITDVSDWEGYLGIENTEG